MSPPPHSYSRTFGASARFTLVSETCGLGAPTVVSFTVLPTVARLWSASKGAHQRVPDFFRGVAQLAHEHECPFFPVLADFGAGGRAGHVGVSIAHRFFSLGRGAGFI
jgi:hypothetical protein